MKLLSVSSVLCAMMVLTTVARGCPPIRPGHKLCPPGWTRYHNHCFFYVPNPMDWADAQRHCQSMKANLASVHSLEEYKLIQKVIFDASKANPRTWIGGTNGGQAGYWFWIDGTPFTYTNWCQREPNNLGGRENCMEMNFPGNNCMNDLGCSNTFPSVCVKKFC